MCEAVADCLVVGYEPLIEALKLPDPGDRHVLAAAIRCSAQVIVTSSVKDFPALHLEPFNIEAQTPTSSCFTSSNSRPDGSQPLSSSGRRLSGRPR